MSSSQATHKGKMMKKKNKTSKIDNLWPILMLLLISIRPISSAIQRHKFLGTHILKESQSKFKLCKSDTETEVTSMWLKENTPISFSTQGSITATQFISGDDNNKQYSMLERGSANCYMPSSTYKGWIFLGLVVEQHPTTPNTCYVSRVITTSHLEPCSESPPPNLETLFRFESGTYDLIPKNSWSLIDWNNINSVTSTVLKFTLTSSFTFTSINEDFMELLILKRKSPSDKPSNNFFQINTIENIRKAYYALTQSNIFTGGDLVRKNIVDGLLGFT